MFHVKMTTKLSQLTTNLSRWDAKPTSSLAQLFPNPTLVRVLSLFFLHPGERFYQRDIAERTRSALIQVQRALKRMELAGDSQDSGGE